jgi:bidirectional [NiFe] hydrogenase diaphorase subunit
VPVPDQDQEIGNAETGQWRGVAWRNRPGAVGGSSRPAVSRVRRASSLHGAAMALQQVRPTLPSDDKRWKLVNGTMRRNGYAGHALIETLHTVQDAFGYLDEPSLRFVAASLDLPLSKVFGVATFYHLFMLKPKGRHACVVCAGTACYIKGAGGLVDAVEHHFGVKPGETTGDDRLSVLTARCVGACGLAPAVVIDGSVLGKQTADGLVAKIGELR